MDGLNLMMFAAIIAVFYFILIRPQRQEQKAHERRLAALKKGDKVITAGGIHGTITGINDKVLTLRIAKSVEIDINRASISTVLTPEKDAPAEKEKKGKESAKAEK